MTPGCLSKLALLSVESSIRAPAMLLAPVAIESFVDQNVSRRQGRFLSMRDCERDSRASSCDDRPILNEGSGAVGEINNL
jgi:hypothetical protein